MAFPFKSGFLTDRGAQALRDLERRLERIEHHNQADSVGSLADERFDVKLTAQDGGTPLVYSGTEQWFDATTGSYTDKVGGRTFSPTTMPIYERNGVVLSSFPFYVEVVRRNAASGVPCYEFSAASASAAGGRVYGQANDLPALPGSGPRQTVDISEAHPTVGDTALVTLTDDPANDRLKFVIDALGEFVRHNSGSNIGPRRRLNFVDDTGYTWVITDASGSDEVTIKITLDTCTSSQSISGWNGAVVQILGHDSAGACKWYNVSAC